MSFMQLVICKKGALYSVECGDCGTVMYTHEWATHDHNDRRDAMQNGTLRCEECHRSVDKETFRSEGRKYAAQFSDPGYLDCTEWTYGGNKRLLARDVRSMHTGVYSIKR